MKDSLNHQKPKNTAAYLWIDLDSGHVSFFEDPDGRKTELNPLMGYVTFAGPREKIYKKFLKLQKKPWLIERIIKI